MSQGKKIEKNFYLALFTLLVLTFLFSCEQEEPIALPECTTTRCEQDKKSIAQSYLLNVEYYRKYHIYRKPQMEDNVKIREDSTHYSKYPGVSSDMTTLFWPYATRYDLEKDMFVASPIETWKQLSVTTEVIFYSKDSLLCVALMCKHVDYDDIKGLDTKRDKGTEYDADAIIGQRDNKSERFKIYPFMKFFVGLFDSEESATMYIAKMYMKDLKGDGFPTGSELEGKNFPLNLGEEDFFEKTPLFWKTSNGYYFERYKSLGKIYKYYYLSNQPDSVIKKVIPDCNRYGISN